MEGPTKQENNFEIPATEKTKNGNLISRLNKIAKKLTVYGSLTLSMYGAYTGFVNTSEKYTRAREIQEMKLEYEQLENEYGKRFSDMFYVASELGKEKREDGAQRTATSSIELKYNSFTADQVQQVLDTYPKGWVYNEVSSIEQSVEEKEAPKEYGLQDNQKVIADCSHDLYEKSKITFYNSTKERLDSYYVLSELLGHELAHANDWITDNEMSTEDRLELLTAITGRLDSEDRYKSNYVESIVNEDKQREKYLKAVEYWAEICSQYFSDPSSLHVKDFRIVDRVVQKSDLEFSPLFQKLDRTNLITSIIRSHVNTN